MLRRLVVALSAMAVFLGAAMALAALPPGGSFTDDDGNIHESAIEAIAAEGITRGCNPPLNSLYCPDATVTRGQMAAFLVRALGLAADDGDLFMDDDGHVFEGDINKLATAGITRGCNPPANTMYCPDDSVTRGQMAAFLVRAMGYSDSGVGDLFVDDDGSVFEADIDRLGTAGVTKGCNPPVNDRYCPNELVKRDQMASFLTRALGLTPIVPPPPTSSTTTTVPPNPGDSVNCSDFNTWTEAQAWFDLYYPFYGDVADLDADGDLIACEGLPGAPGEHPQSGDGWKFLGCSDATGTCTYPQGTAEANVTIDFRLLPPKYCLPDPFEPWRCMIESEQWNFEWFDPAGEKLSVLGTGCSFQYVGSFLNSVTCYLPITGVGVGEYRGELCRTEWPSSTCVEELLSVFFQVVP